MSTRKSFDSEATRAIGARIREARGKDSQAEFAKLIDVDRATLSNYETGRRTPNADVLDKIAYISGLTKEYILHGVRDEFDMVRDAYEKTQAQWLENSNAVPGYYPKWFFSDLEVAIVRCFRNLEEETKSKVLRIIADEASELDKYIQREVGTTGFTEASTRVLLDACERKEFPKGEDVDQAFWAFGFKPKA